MGWLQYLSQMFGISPAQAETLMQGHGDGPPGPLTPKAMYNVSNPAPNPNPPGPGNVGPVNPPAPDTLTAQPAAVPQPFQGPDLAAATNNAPRPPLPRPGPPAGPAAPLRPPNTMGLQPGALSPSNLASLYSMPTPSGGGGMPVGAPGTMSSATPPVNPAATGGATAQGATANPRFIGLDWRPNAPAEGGGMQGRGGPQATALNLGGLFNRGQPAASADVPAPNAQPVAAVRGPLARPDLAQRVPLANAPTPPVMPPDVAAARAAAANPSAAARARMLRPPYYG
jgi:hypothetical protein